MNETTGQKPIIVGVDGSPSSIDALRKAAELAEALGAPIEAVTAWDWEVPFTYSGPYVTEITTPADEAKETLSRAIDTAFPAGAPEGLTRSIIAGPAASALITTSSRGAMLVLGSRGRGGFAGMLLGSVSTACAQRAQCPVLIMHTPKHHRGASAKSAPEAERHPG